MYMKYYLNAVLTCNETFKMCFLIISPVWTIRQFLLASDLQFYIIFLCICMSLVYKDTNTLLSAKVFLNLFHNFLYFHY